LDLSIKLFQIATTGKRLGLIVIFEKQRASTLTSSPVLTVLFYFPFINNCEAGRDLPKPIYQKH